MLITFVFSYFRVFVIKMPGLVVRSTLGTLAHPGPDRGHRHNRLIWTRSSRASFSSLSVLKVSLDTIHSLFNLFHGICIAKPKIPLGIGPKIDSRSYPHVGILKDIESQFVGIS